ncbi:hypothetical protein BGZ63DRAFT_392710 [Mariannaea sp. PMI_226]|nr:hypothetical protein BGZ63DRAFT_392710 [Mariannaea sp. PMI_226]
MKRVLSLRRGLALGLALFPPLGCSPRGTCQRCFVCCPSPATLPVGVPPKNERPASSIHISPTLSLLYSLVNYSSPVNGGLCSSINAFCKCSKEPMGDVQLMPLPFRHHWFNSSEDLAHTSTSGSSP